MISVCALCMLRKNQRQHCGTLWFGGLKSPNPVSRQETDCGDGQKETERLKQAKMPEQLTGASDQEGENMK